MSWNPLRRRTESDPAEWTGFLDRGVRFEGKLELVGTFRIDGCVKGEILSKDNLMLGEHAQVEGRIEANQLAISGRFEGTIVARGRVEILPKAVVSGEIYAACLVIEPGGIFDGRCHMSAPASNPKTVTIPIRTSGSA